MPHRWAQTHCSPPDICLPDRGGAIGHNFVFGLSAGRAASSQISVGCSLMRKNTLGVYLRAWRQATSQSLGLLLTMLLPPQDRQALPSKCWVVPDKEQHR